MPLTSGNYRDKQYNTDPRLQIGKWPFSEGKRPFLPDFPSENPIFRCFSLGDRRFSPEFPSETDVVTRPFCRVLADAPPGVGERRPAVGHVGIGGRFTAETQRAQRAQRWVGGGAGNHLSRVAGLLRPGTTKARRTRRDSRNGRVASHSRRNNREAKEGGGGVAPHLP